VIVRCRDSERTIEKTFASMRAQTTEVEIVAVDSGSRDRTLEIARRWCDQLLQVAPWEFSYGRALNMGARAASAPVHFALSSHCAPPTTDWVERSLALYERSHVAATNGGLEVPGRPALGPRDVFLQDHAHARANPYWGFSNHASSWRASVWEEHPFDERLDYAEDKEWALRVTADGWAIAYAPDLLVDQSHAWRSAGEYYGRRKRTVLALSTFTGLPPYGIRDLARDWWNALPPDRHSRFSNRFLNYRRLAGLAGWYVGHRAAARR
jgi:rhamnosyltransferase